MKMQYKANGVKDTKMFSKRITFTWRYKIKKYVKMFENNITYVSLTVGYN